MSYDGYEQYNKRFEKLKEFKPKIDKPQTVYLKTQYKIYNKDGKELSKQEVAKILPGISIAYDREKGEYARELLQWYKYRVEETSNQEEYDKYLAELKNWETYQYDDVRERTRELYLAGLIDIDDNYNWTWQSRFTTPISRFIEDLEDDDDRFVNIQTFYKMYDQRMEKAIEILEDFAEVEEITHADQIYRGLLEKADLEDLVVEMLKAMEIVE